MNTDTPDTQPEKSEAQQKFEAGLKQVLSVSKKDLNTILAEEKREKQSAKEARQS